jgi:site-specific recombinase XerD
MGHLLQAYKLYAATEGKSPSAAAIVTNSVNYFQGFLISQGISIDVTQISHNEIRSFTIYLQQKRCFSSHRYNHTQDRGLSGNTINCYLRSLRIFFWLISEGIIEANPFDRVKIPRSPGKVIPTFSNSQIQQLLNAIDNRIAEMI